MPSSRPFRLEKFWLQHPAFKEFVDLHWSNDSDSVYDCNSNLGLAAKSWAKSIFGNIFEKKMLLRNDYKGLKNFR